MKKPKLALIGVVALAVIVGLALVVKSQDNADDDVTQSQTSNNKSGADVQQNKAGYASREASEILTNDLAKKAAAKGVNTDPAPDSKVPELRISTSSYSGTIGLVSLTSRSPLNKVAADNNAKQFAAGKPADTQVVPGLGDAAYWEVKNTQLNILKNNNWYTLAVGSPNARVRTLDQTKQFATQIIDKL